MKKNLSLFMALALCLTGALMAFAGCGNPKKADSKNTVTDVTLNEVAHSIFYAPMYVAIEEGYFKEEGINLELVTGFGADKTMTAVLSGEADIGFMDRKPQSTPATKVLTTMLLILPSLLSAPATSWWPVRNSRISSGMTCVEQKYLAEEKAVCRKWYLNTF